MPVRVKSMKTRMLTKQRSCCATDGISDKISIRRDDHEPWLLDGPSSLLDTPSALMHPSELVAESNNCTPSVTSTMIRYEHFPTEILGLIESYLPPSDCAHISATSTSLHRRWNARRWQRTFQLHYGRGGNRLRRKERTVELRRARKRLMKLLRSRYNEGSQHLEWQHSDFGGDSISNGNLMMDEEECTATLQHSAKNSMTDRIKSAFAKYDKCYKDGWEFTFVGCCHDRHGGICAKCKEYPSSRSCGATVCPGSDNNKSKTGLSNETRNANSNETVFVQQNQSHGKPQSTSGDNFNVITRADSYDDMSAFTTQFNVTALVPSVRRLYVDLWDTIELSLLGYYDADETEAVERGSQRYTFHHPTHHSQYPVPAIMRILRTSVLPELAEYLYFVIGMKPLVIRGINDSRSTGAARRRRRRRDGGVMGPLLSRGLGGVNRRGSESSVGDSNARLGVTVSQEYIGAQSYSSSPQTNLQDSGTTTLEEINSLRDAATTMSAWKLACFLRERGVGCLRCAICDQIDLMGDDFEEENTVDDCEGGISLQPEDDDSAEQELVHGSADNSFSRDHYRHYEQTNGGGRRSPFLRDFQRQIGGGGSWMSPCQCPELVHRQCLERKLKLVAKYRPWERFKIHFARCCAVLREFLSVSKSQVGPNRTFSVNLVEDPIAPRVWISYDNNIPVQRERHLQQHEAPEMDEEDIVAVDDLGQFLSPSAYCQTCGCRFLRAVRLPRSKWEVLSASLSDPVSMIRAASTFAHFVLVCAFLAACEGMCKDASCDSHRTLLETRLGAFKWPTTGFNGMALAWWQLQQCCMLHIFFSRRFAAIVDRLWMGPISLFYCRLYFYFIVTSALLAASYIPMVSRTIRINILEKLLSPLLLSVLQPVWGVMALANLVQYAVVSTTVVCIFWRTNYRIFTVADGKEAAAILRGREELARNSLQGAGAVTGRLRDDLRQHAHAPAIGARERMAEPVVINAPQMQRIVGVGAGDDNAANHPMYHGPW